MKTLLLPVPQDPADDDAGTTAQIATTGLVLGKSFQHETRPTLPLVTTHITTTVM